jgi:hypothetical protein
MALSRNDFPGSVSDTNTNLAPTRSASPVGWKVVKLPQDLSKSGQFPESELLHQTVDQRMSACREMLHLVNEMERYEVESKARIIKNAIKEIASPIIESRRLSNLQQRKARMQQEGIGSALGVLAKGAVQLGAHELGINRNIISFGKKIFKAATTTTKPKPLRSITPKKQSTMDIDAASGSGILGSKSKQKKQQPTSGVSILEPNQQRTNPGMQLRRVDMNTSVLSKTKSGGSRWDKKIMS